MTKLTNREENKIFFTKFFSSFLWGASGVSVKDIKYNKMNRLEKMSFLRDKLLKKQKGHNISSKGLTRKV